MLSRLCGHLLGMSLPLVGYVHCIFVTIEARSIGTIKAQNSLHCDDLCSLVSTFVTCICPLDLLKSNSETASCIAINTKFQ